MKHISLLMLTNPRFTALSFDSDTCTTNASWNPSLSTNMMGPDFNNIPPSDLAQRCASLCMYKFIGIVKELTGLLMPPEEGEREKGERSASWMGWKQGACCTCHAENVTHVTLIYAQHVQ